MVVFRADTVNPFRRQREHSVAQGKEATHTCNGMKRKHPPYLHLSGEEMEAIVIFASVIEMTYTFVSLTAL